MPRRSGGTSERSEGAWPLRRATAWTMALGLGCGSPPSKPAPQLAAPPPRPAVTWEAAPVPPSPTKAKAASAELVPQWTGPLTAAALHPRGTHVAIASHGRVSVVRTRDAVVVAQLNMPRAGAAAVFFNDDGSRLAALSTAGGLRVWATDDLRVVGDDESPCEPTEACAPEHATLRGNTLAWRRGPKLLVAHLGRARVHELHSLLADRIYMSPSGRHVLAARGGHGDLFDLRADSYGSFREERVGATSSDCKHVDITADATWFVHHGCEQDAIRLQGVQPGGPGLHYSMRPHSLRIAPRGDRMVWISPAGELIDWKAGVTSVLATNAKDAALGPGAAVLVRYRDDTVALVHPDGRQRSFGNPGPGLLTFDRAKAHLLMQEANTTTVLALASGERFTLPSRGRLELSHPGAGPVTTLVWWEGRARWRQGRTGAWVSPPHAKRPPLAWRGGGAVMAGCASNVFRWEDGSVQSSPALEGRLRLSRDRRWAVVTREDGSVDRVTLAKLGEPALRLLPPPAKEQATLVVLGPKSRRVVLARVSPWPRPSGTGWKVPIEVYDLDTGRVISSFVPGFEPRNLAFTPDGQQVLVGEGYGAMHNLSYWAGSRVERWDVARGIKRGELPGAMAGLSPGARYVFTLVGHPTRSEVVETRLFDAVTLQPVLTLPGHPLVWRDGDLYTERYAHVTTNRASERIGIDRFAVPSGKPMVVGWDWSLNAELHRDVSTWDGRAYASSLRLHNGEVALVPEGVTLAGHANPHTWVLSWPKGQVRFVDQRDGATLDVVATYREDGGCAVGAFDDRGRTEGVVPMMRRQGHGMHAEMAAMNPSQSVGLVEAFLQRKPRAKR